MYLGGGSEDQQAELKAPQEVNLTIQTNDDPSGLLIFAESSRRVSIAEDYVVDNTATKVDLVVKRTQGTINAVQVCY